MKNRNGKKEKMPANRSKNPGSSLTAGVATAVPATRPGTPTRAANPFAGTKPGGPGAPKATGLGAKAPTGPATDHTEGARLAQERALASVNERLEPIDVRSGHRCVTSLDAGQQANHLHVRTCRAGESLLARGGRSGY